MPRDLPVGNGNLLLNFDSHYVLRDIYFPFVGQENHTSGNPCRFGVWADGAFGWIDDPQWTRDLRYEDDTLVTCVTCESAQLGLRLVCRDTVDFDRNLYVKRVEVHDLTQRPRDVRLFFHLDAFLQGMNVGDTAYYEPINQGLVFYKGQRYLWVGCYANGRYGPAAYATGDKLKNNAEGTWRDAEDGTLSGHPIAQGSVDGVAAVHLEVPAGGEAVGYFWLGAGHDFFEVRDLNRVIRERGLQSFIDRTHNYWHLWVNRQQEEQTYADLPAEDVALYRRSLLTLRTQIDNRGAILAANDADILQFGRDTYSYVWPRDAALTAQALVEAGFSEVTRPFFEFAARTLHKDGYHLHKYNPDGSLGSSWQPWVGPDGGSQIPIQEDETALVIMSLWQYFDQTRDVEFVRPFYRRLIKAAGDFMVQYRDPVTGLPSPSFDLWEERRGVHSFTAGAVWAGLQAAANFTERFGEASLGRLYRQAASEVRAGTLRFLFDSEKGWFSRTLNLGRDGQFTRDSTLDASLCGLFAFGMLPPDHPQIVSTMRALEARLWCKTPVGGVARYENDYYHQVSQDVANVPGNPWFVCTLWLADWYIQCAQTLADLHRPAQLLAWVRQHALASGVLAEQVHPFTGEPLSVSPLTWSHAAHVHTVHLYLRRYQELNQPRRRTTDL